MVSTTGNSPPLTKSSQSAAMFKPLPKQLARENVQSPMDQTKPIVNTSPGTLKTRTTKLSPQISETAKKIQNQMAKRTSLGVDTSPRLVKTSPKTNCNQLSPKTTPMQSTTQKLFKEA